MRQWNEDRDPRCRCLKFNTRMVAFFAVDLEDVRMTTRLEGEKTFFLPFNQGSAGAGNDGGAGNPPNPEGYAVSHLWEVALQKDSLLDIVHKFLHLEVKEAVSYTHLVRIDENSIVPTCLWFMGSAEGGECLDFPREPPGVAGIERWFILTGWKDPHGAKEPLPVAFAQVLLNRSGVEGPAPVVDCGGPFLDGEGGHPDVVGDHKVARHCIYPRCV